MEGNVIPLGMLYWAIWLVALFLSFYWYAPYSDPYRGSWRPFGGSFFSMVMFFIIGLRLFGFPIHG